jgi:hypothetical protein
MSRRKETTCPGNIYLRIPSEQRDVWAVAPSCWNHPFPAPCSSKTSFNLGRRKFSSIAQYRSEVTVTVTLSSSKKVRTQHTKPKNGTPHSNLGAVGWPLVKFPRDAVRPVPEILFVDCERHAASLSANRHFEWTPRQKKCGAHPIKPWCELRTAWTQLSNDTSLTALTAPHP